MADKHFSIRTFLMIATCLNLGGLCASVHVSTDFMHKVLSKQSCFELLELLHRLEVNEILGVHRSGRYATKIKSFKDAVLKVFASRLCPPFSKRISIRKRAGSPHKGLSTSTSLSAQMQPPLFKATQHRIRERNIGSDIVIKKHSSVKSPIKLLKGRKIRREIVASPHCSRYWIGDGLCDLGCNSWHDNYDGGDCCEESCLRYPRFYPCGITGYQCRELNHLVPFWFTGRTKLCFKFQTANDTQGKFENENKDFCAPVGAMTRFYPLHLASMRGYQFSWMVATSGYPKWFQTLKLCYRFQSNTSNIGCSTKIRYDQASCAPVNRWTNASTDMAECGPGCCQLAWKLTYPKERDRLPHWFYTIRLCVYWFSSGRGTMCGTLDNQKLQACSKLGQWTPSFKDVKTTKENQCHLAWSIVLG